MTDAHYPQLPAPTPAKLAGRAFICLLAVLVLTACAGNGGTRDRTGFGKRYQQSTASSALSNDVLIRAIGLVGTGYRYGGNTPEGGFDCSGLVDFVFSDAAGLDLPRSTRELVDIDAPRIDRDELQPGDLVYFSPEGGAVSHIGIYVGEGRFVHAPSTGGTVRLDTLGNNYWNRAYQGAKRVLR